MASRDLQQEIEQFLYGEARLLDAGRFGEWLELFADDVRYFVPTRETRLAGERIVSAEGELALMEDDKRSLGLRIKRFDTGLAHAETPRSRTRHFVMNLEILREDGNELEVHSNVLVFQARMEKAESFFVGKREDVLRRSDGGWRIARRTVILDQILLPRAISIFF